MGTTLTALTSGSSLARVWVVAIEGYPYLLTSGDTASTLTAWSGTDWSQALSGLAVKQDARTEIDPWDPFKDGGEFVFSVLDEDGTDRFGIDVSRKEGGTSSPLAASKDPDDTTIVVLNSDDFDASGTIYVGSEAIAYTTNTTGTETFSGLTRGKWSPFTTSGGGRYARTHRINSTIPGVPPQATPATIARTFPTEWVGKYVAVYLHRNAGGTLDTKAQAHLAFAGRIAQIDDEADGTTTVSCDHILKTIAEGVVFREPFRARAAEGIYLPSTAKLYADSSRLLAAGSVLTTGLANPLTFSAGFYTVAELVSAINSHLLSEYAAGRLVLRAAFDLYTITADGTRSSVTVADATAGDARRWFMMWSDYAPLMQFMGIQPPGLEAEWTGTEQSHFGYSQETPLRVLALPGGSAGTQAQVNYEQSAGSFVDQSLFIPNALDQAAFTKGVLRIGQGYYVCDTPDGDSVNIQRLEVLDRLAGLSDTPRTWLTYDEPGDIEIQQIILAQSTLRALVMSMLTSTGANAFNDSSYDVWPEQMGLAIPHSILSTLDDQLAVAPEANKIMTIPIDKPTRFVDLWNVDFILRHICLIWRQETLTLTGFATPTSEASLSITADDKATPTDAQDNLRIVTRHSDKWMRNSITIKHGRTLFSGEYLDTPVVIDDKASQNAYGTRAITLEGRNFIAGGGILGQDLFALLPSFTAGLPFITRPSMTCSIPVSYNLFETHTAGEAVLLTDTFARDPTSGERGLTGKPSLVISSHYDHGGTQHGNPPSMRPPSGQLEVMLFPGRTLARYSPAGQLDDTANSGGFSAGYSSGASTLRLYANKYSDVDPGEVVDAANFPAGAKIEITEIDPADPAAPLQWSRTVQSQSGNDVVLTSGLSSPAFDSTKLYLVRPQTYSSATTTQQARTFQGDDADQRIEDLREPFAYAFFGAGQVDSFQAWSASELAERYADTAFGDGKALDTAYAHGSARNLNILRDYKTAPQCPYVYTESRGYTSGTWDLVSVQLVWVGRGSYGTLARSLYLAPIINSVDGSTANVRVTLARTPPVGTALADVTRVAPYRSNTFTTTSMTDVIPTSVAFATSHLKLADNAMNGLGYLYVEVNNKATFKGFAEQFVGPFS